MIVTIIGIATLVLPAALAWISFRQYRRYRNQFFQRTAAAFGLVFVGYMGPVLFSSSLGLRATVLIWSLIMMASMGLLVHAFRNYKEQPKGET